MNDFFISIDENSNLESIDLTYEYTKDTLKHLHIQIQHLRSRSSTFLGFGGVLLRFTIDLSDSDPIYLFLKLSALMTCVFSLFLLSESLKSYPKDGASFRDTVEDFLQKNNALEFKKSGIEKNIQSCEYLSSVAYKIKFLLNISISFLLLSALSFAVNVILVSYLGK